jgi:hypothetical protein
MDNLLGKLYSRPMTFFTTSNMRPIICSPIQRRVLAGLCREAALLILTEAAALALAGELVFLRRAPLASCPANYFVFI